MNVPNPSAEATYGAKREVKSCIGVTFGMICIIRGRFPTKGSQLDLPEKVPPFWPVVDIEQSPPKPRESSVLSSLRATNRNNVILLFTSISPATRCKDTGENGMETNQLYSHPKPQSLVAIVRKEQIP